MDRKSWSKKFQLVKSAWRTLRPGEAIESSRLSSLDFGVTFSREITDRARVSLHVSGWKIGTSEWSLRVRLLVLDKKVEELRAEVIKTYDTSGLAVLDFDILAAAALIEGRELDPSPSMELGSSAETVLLVLKEFSDKIDRIWSFAGGFTILGLETLSIWVIRNRSVVGVGLADIGVICTAFTYGEHKLSKEILREYEIDLERRRRREIVNEETRAIHAILSEEVRRLWNVLA